ncbi:MAG: hypothetical protein DME31_10115 [Verrucomicrobia bacterium]|nr:MAG: hypothetical protein DME31_10115 [Verrucomicrobiota bacterium]
MLHEVIWRLSDRAALQRQIEVACARAGYPELATVWFDHFMKQLQLHPLEWPSSTRAPSEHTWEFGGQLCVCYRLIPDSQTVEILSVTGTAAPSDAR